MNPKTEKLLAAHDEFYTEIFRVARIVLKLERNESRSFDDGDTVEFYGDTIEIGWEEYHCGCCGPDHEDIAFPISYLFNEDWEKELQEKKAKEQAEKEARALKEKQEAAARKLEKERKKYLELRAKFEGGK